MTRAESRQSWVREAAWVSVFAAVLSVALTWPLAAHPASRLGAPAGAGDPYLNVWILGWDLGTVVRDPSAVLTGRIFDANIFFPAERTLAYSDHLILQAVALAPLFLAARNVTLCYNALLLLSLFGCVVSMYAFVRAVTGSRAGALVAGTAWGFTPFHFAHLLHLQLQSLYWLPLAFLCLHRVMAGRRRRDAILLGACAGLQAASSVYWGVIGAVALATAAVALAVAVGRWRSIAIARRLLLAAVVGAVIVAPFAWPYWQVQQREGFTRNLYEASQHEATPASYVRVPPQNLLYGRTGLLRPPSRPAGRNDGPEQELFPGFAVAALALAGAWRGWRRDDRPLVVSMVSVAVVGGVLSLGPDGLRAAYSLLHRFVFGFQAVRAPARFGVLVTFALSVLAAVAVREFGRDRGGPVDRRRRRSIAAGAAVALVGIECVNLPMPTVAAPPETTAVGRFLAREPDPGAVLYLPLDADLGNTTAMVQSLEHRRPIVNGYSGQRPAFFMGLVDTLNQLPARESLWALRDLNVRFVVSPTPLAGERDGPLVERARFGADRVYELRWSPEAEAAVPRPELPAPPEAGRLPFDRDEKAVYRLMWLSGAALGLPAGQATIGASAGPAGGPRHLVLDVATAGWVARFFEARDRFETWADADLLPTRQEQHLREGRRVIDRATRFDPASRTVTTGEGPPLPLPRGARDALSAFFYARTLPLATGYAARFPVVEGGRSFVVDLAVDRVERVPFAGRQVEAFRVSPRLTSRGDRRRTVRATVWIATDASRVPLVLEIETGFGSFRAELVRYEGR